jgi:3'(2'), 5'-bisphosphate nucleotidase
MDTEREGEVFSILRGAGNILMKYHGKKYNITSKSKTFYDPVTTADLEADAYIKEHLKSAFPDIQVLTEEDSSVHIDYSKDVWVVDPLDGTRPFIGGSKNFSSMICLLKKGKPVFGAIYAPVSQELYYADSGKGAHIRIGDKTERLHVSSVDSLGKAREITRTPMAEKNVLDRFIGNLHVHQKIEMSSLGLRMCMVAKGSADLYINTIPRVNKWDTAAPEAILREAGGIVTDFYGNSLDYAQPGLKWERSLIASNSLLHKEIIGLIPADAISMMNTESKESIT